jgi:NTP pyrophosphatase (non-canonical NTP hydrolase)
MMHGKPINGKIDYFKQGEFMGYGTDGLTFNTLRVANTARLPEFKNKHGGLAHSLPDGSDWSPAQWLQAVVGELGEYANIRKKYERGDIDATEFWREARDELADVVTYLDILAMQLGIDLGMAVTEKFNRVSVRVGSTVRISPDGCSRSNE